MKKVAPKQSADALSAGVVGVSRKELRRRARGHPAAPQGGAQQPAGPAARCTDRLPARVLCPGRGRSRRHTATRSEPMPGAPTAGPDRTCAKASPPRRWKRCKPMLQDEKLDSDTLALAGEVYVQNGDRAAAARYFEKAAALDPKNTGKRTAVGALAPAPKGESERASRNWKRSRPKTPGSGRTLRWSRSTSGNGSSTRRWPRSPRSKRSSRTSLCRTTCAARCCSRRAMSRARGAASNARWRIDPAYFPAATNLARLDLRTRSRRTRRSASKRSWPRIRRTRRRSSRSPTLRARSRRIAGRSRGVDRARRSPQIRPTRSRGSR